MAAQWFSVQQVEFGIFEVGLGGRYDATNAWDSKISVLTKIDLDDTEILSSDVMDVIKDKIHIARPGDHLFTTDKQNPKVLSHIRQHCIQKGIILNVSTRLGVDVGSGIKPYTWNYQVVKLSLIHI